MRRRLTDFSEGGDEMNAVKILAIVLIVAGILGLLYGKFSYTKETHDVKLGPLEMSIAEKETVNVPLWAGVMAILGGGALLVYASKKG
jgi:drug/metabolite transporter (DMT)-like permease